MEVGIGLPNTVPGTSGKQLVEWARRADEAGFSRRSSPNKALSLNELSGGRAVLGVAVGPREDDYELAGWIMGGGTPKAMKERKANVEAGCDELILFPTSPELEQVEVLAEVAL